MIRRLAIISLSMTMVLGGTACSSRNSQDLRLRTPVIKGELPSGLRLVVLPDKRMEWVQIDVRTIAGSMWDPPGKEGLANFVTLLRVHSYPRTATTESKHPAEPTVHEVGDAFGYATSDVIHVRRRIPKSQLARALEDEERRLRKGCFFYSEDHIEALKKELIERLAAVPLDEEDRHTRALTERLYPEGHPYRRPVGGSAESIASFTRADVCRFLRRTHKARGTIVLLSGDVDHEVEGQLAGKVFGNTQSAGLGDKVVTRPEFEPGMEVLEGSVEDSTMDLLWRLPPHFTDRYDDASVLMVAMAELLPARLEARAGCKLRRVSELGGRLAPVLRVSFSFGPGAAAGPCLEELWRALPSLPLFLGKPGDWEPDWQKKLANLRLFARMSLPSLRADFVADAVQFDERHGFMTEDNPVYQSFDRIAQVTPERLDRAVRDVLDKEQALIIVRKPAPRGAKGKP